MSITLPLCPKTLMASPILNGRATAKYKPAIALPIKFEAAKPITTPEIVLIDAAITGFWERYEIMNAITIMAPTIRTKLFMELAVSAE
jgi:hypothetical protein